MAKIKRIIRRRVSGRPLYNLAVETDESYVSDGIVVHNCRSLLVPITKYETFEVDDEVAGGSINEFIEANKGDGFARR